MNYSDIGMDTASLAGSLESKLAAVRGAELGGLDKHAAGTTTPVIYTTRVWFQHLHQ